MRYLYLLIDFCAFIVPFIFSFHPKIKFYKSWPTFFPGLAITALVFIRWDELFTAKAVWGFNPDYITGIYFLHLPLEELLFFICIPYACVFTYYCLNLFYNIAWKENTEKIAVTFLSIILLTTGLLFYNRIYTSVTFVSLSILLLLFKYIFKVKWIGKLLSIYLVLLVPFFIVNGILTGTGLHQPVVWYNNAENLGIRIFTIPIEDFFYGFEMILLNVFFYELFKARFKK